MKNKIKLSLISLIMCFCACSCKETNTENPVESGNENSGKVTDEEVLKYYKNDNYIVGRKIMDDYHWGEENPTIGSISVPEIPNLRFTYESGKGITIEEDGKILFKNIYNLYIADVNQDGYFDVCFEQKSRAKESNSSKKFDTVYAYNARSKYLFSVFDDNFSGYRDDSKSYYFDLDKNNVLCVIEANTNLSVYDCIEYNDANRMVKKKDGFAFEPFSFESKILGCDFYWSNKNSLKNHYPQIGTQLCGFVKKGIEFPIKADQIKIEKVSGVDFDYYTDYSKDGIGRFDTYFDYYESGTAEIKITVGDFTSTVTMEQDNNNFYRQTSLGEFDSKNNYYETGFSRFFFASKSYLISDVKDNLTTQIGINDEENIVIKSNEEFDAFKAKIAALETNGKILQKTNEEYPTVDFSTQYMAITAYYKDGHGVDCDLHSLNHNSSDVIEQRIEGSYIDREPVDSTCGVMITYVIVPINRHSYTFTSIVKYTAHDNQTWTGAKPIVYFYPEEEMDLNVRYVNEENLITTYPKYNNGWDIHLNKDGTFTTNGSDREYYALYFDEHSNYITSFDEGFYVTKENAISFLEEKMDYIGYTNREVNEFIMYWLPILEKNGQSLVYFEQIEQRNEECPLEFSTAPDTLIRTMIHIKKVDEKINIPEQQLKHYDRSGFVVTEWGGVEY